MLVSAFIIGARSLICALSRDARTLIIARLFQGFGTLPSMIVTGVLLTEVSPTSIRGPICSTNQNSVRDSFLLRPSF